MRPVAATDLETITKLIKTNPSMQIGGGMELLNRNLTLIRDISEYVQDCTITRNFYDSIHGSCQFTLTTELAWGIAVVRPYMLISGEGMEPMRFNLGAYFTNTPDHVTGQDPPTYSVQGYDLLDALNIDIGESYAVEAGEDYLYRIERMIFRLGYPEYRVDQSRAGTTLPVSRGWAMVGTQDANSGNVTWLNVLNDLLAAIGYRGAYTDWDGRVICEPYVPPRDRSPEWTYDDGDFTSQLGPSQIIKHDFYRTPNKWVGIRTNMPEGQVPTDGNGIFVYQNDSDGETSVEGRGRVITVRVDVEAADQKALEDKVMARVAADTSVGTTIETTTTPNPLHWHADILDVKTQQLGEVRVQSTSWTLSFSGKTMSHTWAVI